ncbi:MAG: hypothetical protein FRX49_10102 [Trebouxia sp. A1-2]|nr:MAG: hypothetical protein FRX49_10102 [Trebouxia sp. A1-2]
MGSASSKAPKRAFPKSQPIPRSVTPTNQTTAQTTPHSIAQPVQAQQQQTADQENPVDHEQDFLLHLKQEGVKDADLGSFLDKLGGAIAGKQHGAAKKVLHHQKEEGRLSTAVLRNLFQDVHRMEQTQKQVDLAALANRYGIEKQLLEKVLHFSRIPAIAQQADGRLFGSWQWKA